jgi:hypothetical protein
MRGSIVITNKPTHIPVPGEDILYTAGPVTGVPDYGKARFAHVTYLLREEGFEVISPIELGRIVDGTYEDYLLRDIKYGVVPATALVMLPGWPHSRGAMGELNTAVTMGYPIGIWDSSRDVVLWVSDFRETVPWPCG